MTHKRLTVLQVLPALESGGVERGTLELVITWCSRVTVRW
jgi:hypothetical protein